MLFADVLLKTDVADQILDVIDTEFAAASDDSENMLTMFLPVLKLKVTEVVDKYAPGVKEMLYGIGLARLFVLELGPLLTVSSLFRLSLRPWKALLLAGRIGGSYAGEIGTMQATNQVC